VEACLKDVVKSRRCQELRSVVDSSPSQVLGDRGQLHIVFSNLIRNARDAMSGRRHARLTASPNRDHVEIQVQDTGVGIAAENLSRIIEPLYSTKAKGIGLGLSIAQEILTRHHGTLRVASQPGAGSTFTISLPSAS
jgi:two-component system sensor kinase FixL